MVKKFILALVGISLSCGFVTARDRDVLHLIYCSDVHYGLTRQFRGTETSADSVSRAMLAAFRSLEKERLPRDGGVSAGEVFGIPDMVVCTGDIANRMEKGVQSATASWESFCRDWAAYSDRLYLVPGNHDISNAIGYTKPMTPLKDAASAAGIYNRMMHPDTVVNARNFDYGLDKIHYSLVRNGIRMVFMGMWPDTLMRAWLDEELLRDNSLPTLIFTHDPPEADAKHFTNPNEGHGINSFDRFENLLADTCCVRNTHSLPLENWRTLEHYLHDRPQIKAYFHGDCNYNEFYTWHGVDSTIALPVFRVDSPMKGEYSAEDETLLSFIVVTIDTSRKILTARECLWNVGSRPSIAWDSVVSVRL